ncbi:MAG: hypothetical protein ACRDM1_08590 [Gaiellaceae bacterium]
MTFDEATQRLVETARRNGGVLTPELVEGDPEFAAEPRITSAAARALDGSTNVFGNPRTTDDAGWFPFERLEFH